MCFAQQPAAPINKAQGNPSDAYQTVTESSYKVADGEAEKASSYQQRGLYKDRNKE